MQTIHGREVYLRSSDRFCLRDSDRLATITSSGGIKFRRLPIGVRKLDHSLYSVAWSPNSELSRSADETPFGSSRAQFRVEKTLETGQEEIWGLAWSPDGTLLACAGKDGTVQLWHDGALQKKLFQGGWTLDIGWNPDGTR